MKTIPLRVDLIPQVHALMELGSPYIRARTDSDYWVYAKLFSTTCPIAVVDGEVAGAVIAFRSQDEPGDIYIQDVMTHPDHRRRGIAHVLVNSVRKQATAWGCDRLYLTSESENTAAHRTWSTMGFVNVVGDFTVEGISVTADFKDPGKDRAVYQLMLK